MKTFNVIKGWVSFKKSSKMFGNFAFVFLLILIQENISFNHSALDYYIGERNQEGPKDWGKKLCYSLVLYFILKSDNF